jgi:hypothetical protein
VAGYRITNPDHTHTRNTNLPTYRFTIDRYPLTINH